MIQAENIGKKYMISHQLHGNYTALRDVIAEKAKIFAQRIITPFSSWKTTSSLEEFWALKNISFDIKKGDCVGIIGYNGAGKSTLLKILSRITEPTTGKVRIYGLVASLLEVGTGFHPELTGRENIFLNGAILGMKKTEIRNKLDEIVSFSGVEKFLDTPVKRFSSGMYVRLAFAVAAHLEPEILLVDEVLSVGDISFQKKCIGKMGDIVSTGRTVLFVSHNMNAIRNLCERAIWIDKGQIIEFGSAQEVVKVYEEKQVKSFNEFSGVAIRYPKAIENLSFYINRVTMMNEKGENTNVFSYNQSIVLILDLQGRPKETNYGIEFKIFKDSGEFACTGTSGILHGIYFDKKIRRVRIDIGPLILTNGKYLILLSIMYGKKRIDIWEDACFFHIVECHPFALPQEIKTPVCVIQHSFKAEN